MQILSRLRQLSSRQKHVIAASYLGWTLDAFDFFILVFVLKDVAAAFDTTIKAATIAVTLTLAMRPVGALLFGFCAERFGRKATLMADVLIYSGLACLSGFAPSLTALIVLRALYGIAMGGEWGVGAALTMESIPQDMRGTVSGILQAGYSSGYLLASVAYFSLYPMIGWRGMFLLGVLPALLILYIRRNVDESPVFLEDRQARRTFSLADLKGQWGLLLWAILMMAAFNFMSHGTQDIYPTFLLQQRHLSSHAVGAIAVVYNIGAIFGGLFFGNLSEKIGRKRAIVIAALLVLPIIPFWVQATSPVGLAMSAFFIQFFSQGAWGVIPAHLNEISPDTLRSTFPGFAYQLGNLLASGNATLQAGIAASRGGNYAFALALVASLATAAVALFAGLGIDARGRRFGREKGS